MHSNKENNSYWNLWGTELIFLFLALHQWTPLHLLPLLAFQCYLHLFQFFKIPQMCHGATPSHHKNLSLESSYPTNRGQWWVNFNITILLFLCIFQTDQLLKINILLILRGHANRGIHVMQEWKRHNYLVAKSIFLNWNKLYCLWCWIWHLNLSAKLEPQSCLSTSLK